MGSVLHGSGSGNPVRKRRASRRRNDLEPLSLVLPKTTGADASVLIGVAESHSGIATVYTGTAEVSALLAGTFCLHGESVAQPRHRVGKFGAYIKSDHPIRRFKRRISECVSSSWKAGLLDSVVIALEFVVERPKSEHPLRVMRNKRPDIDNYIKAALDALNEIVYADDGVVCGLLPFKRYAKPGEPENVIARVYWVMEQC